MTDETYATPSSPFLLLFPLILSTTLWSSWISICPLLATCMHSYTPTSHALTKKKANHKSRFFCAAQMSRNYNSQKRLFPLLFLIIFWSLAFTRKEMPSTASSSDSTIVVPSFSPLTWLNSVSAWLAAMIWFLLPLFPSFFVYWDTRIYSFCIAMLCFTFLLSLLPFLNFSG